MKYPENEGRLTPGPGTVTAAVCGICNTSMNVTRNVLGPTSWAEAMARHQHLHDVFRCPNYDQDWHQRVIQLYYESASTLSTELRKLIQKEIATILASRTVPK